MSLYRLTGVILFIILCGKGYGDYHVSPLQHADWQSYKSRTLCRLLQKIDHVGSAGFLHHSGEPLQFFLQDAQFQPAISQASLFVEPAPWQDSLTYRQDYQVFLEDSSSHVNRLVVFADTAENMLYSLLQGYYPVFSFVRQNREIRVAVSSINFSESYSEFADCRKTLLPFGERQLEQDSLYFFPQSNSLTSKVLERLRQVAAYLQEIKMARVVVVSETAMAGKADEKWFKSRATHIVNNLVKFGVAKNRVSVKSGPYHQARENELLLRVFGPDAVRLFYFRKGNTALNHKEKRRLEILARYINDFYPTGSVIINSHTDSKGSRSSNLTVSQQRGEAVMTYLVKQGVAPERLSVKAYGESQPVKSNRFPTGRAQNRRVVISFVN